MKRGYWQCGFGWDCGSCACCRPVRVGGAFHNAAAARRDAGLCTRELHAEQRFWQLAGRPDSRRCDGHDLRETARSVLPRPGPRGWRCASTEPAACGGVGKRGGWGRHRCRCRRRRRVADAGNAVCARGWHRRVDQCCRGRRCWSRGGCGITNLVLSGHGVGAIAVRRGRRQCTGIGRSLFRLGGAPVVDRGPQWQPCRRGNGHSIDSGWSSRCRRASGWRSHCCRR